MHVLIYLFIYVFEVIVLSVEEREKRVLGTCYWRRIRIRRMSRRRGGKGRKEMHWPCKFDTPIDT